MSEVRNEINRLEKWFKYDHLPEHLQEVSQPFNRLAGSLVLRAPDSYQTTVALNRLLEAKDAAVRAAIEAKEDANATR